jgi:5'-deoxynucleotidase YfbR-like HD superfamily hydrolase
MKNRISVRIAKKFKDGLLALFHEIPEARARKERAYATTKEIEAYDQLLKFLETAGYFPGERKSIIAKILASKSSEDNPIKQLQVINDLAKRKRISCQITNEAKDENGSQDSS